MKKREKIVKIKGNKHKPLGLLLSTRFPKGNYCKLWDFGKLSPFYSLLFSVKTTLFEYIQFYPKIFNFILKSSIISLRTVFPIFQRRISALFSQKVQNRGKIREISINPWFPVTQQISYSEFSGFFGFSGIITFLTGSKICLIFTKNDNI